MFWAFSLAWPGVAPLHRLAVGRVAWGDHWLLAQRDAVTTAQLLVLLSLAAFLAGAALPVRAAAPGTTRLDPARTVRAAGVVIAFAVLLLPLAARAGGGFASLGVYDEANNSENLRLTWQQAIDGGADWGQLVTWNDYAEGTQFAPSVHSGGRCSISPPSTRSGSAAAPHRGSSATRCTSRTGCTPRTPSRPAGRPS